MGTDGYRWAGRARYDREVPTAWCSVRKERERDSCVASGGASKMQFPCSISPTWQSEATHEAAASAVQRHGREVHRRLGATGSSCPDWCSASRARPHWQGASVNARSLGQDAKPPFPARRQEKSIQEPGQRGERWGEKRKKKKSRKRTHRFESAGGCWPRCLCLYFDSDTRRDELILP